MNKKLLAILFAVTMLMLTVLCVSAQFIDKFDDSDYESNGWYESVLIGNPNANYIFPERRRISFRTGNIDTYYYFLNENTDNADQVVEASFENVYSSNAAYGLVCRYHDYGWYEFRINISGEFAGSYEVYKYDQYLKDQHKAPYVNLHPGMDRYYTYDIKLGLNQKNTLKFICEGNEFRIFINDIEQRPLKTGYMTDSDFDDGLAGITIQSHLPGGYSQIDLTKFSAE